MNKNCYGNPLILRHAHTHTHMNKHDKQQEKNEFPIKFNEPSPNRNEKGMLRNLGTIAYSN